MESSDIEECWNSAIWGLAKGLEMLRDDCGVLIPRWLPYATMLNPLAAVLGKLGLSGTPEVGANKQKLTRWFWCSVLGQTYENAPNSQTAKDVTELLGWLKGEAAHTEAVQTFRLDPRVL